jgi:hypothetical protein
LRFVALVQKADAAAVPSKFKTTARVHVADENGKIIQKQWCKAQE